MDTPKIQSVKPLENKGLLVKFENGIEKIYDCNQLLHLEVFRLLESDAFFKSVKVDAGGYGISWNDDVDLSEYELSVNSKELSLVESLLHEQKISRLQFGRFFIAS
jgi:hypothetical protein